MKRIKPIILLFFATLVTASLSGCVVVNYSNLASGSESVEGVGERKVMEYSVPEYASVFVGANVDVQYSETPFDVITVEIQENLIEHLTLDVTNKTLSVVSDVNFMTSDDQRPLVRIQAPSLESLSCTGTVNIKDSSPIRGSAFRLLADGRVNGSLEKQIAE